MKEKNYSNIELLLISDRNEIFEKIKKVFSDKAIESHLFGSLARGEDDPYSDIDIWFTFKNEDIKKILSGRLKLYSQVGEIINICEPPQNAPINGVHTSIVYKTKGGYVMVDFYLCPLSTSHKTLESKKIFGIDLPIREMEFNTKKVKVTESYRIDFLIIFIVVAVKNLIRHKENFLERLYDEYSYLEDRYGLKTEPLLSKQNNFESLKELINKVKKISNKKQQNALYIVEDFIEKVK